MTKCKDKGEGQNYCSEWCNTDYKFGCYRDSYCHKTEEGSWPLLCHGLSQIWVKPDMEVCDCAGCNGCPENPS